MTNFRSAPIGDLVPFPQLCVELGLSRTTMRGFFRKKIVPYGKIFAGSKSRYYNVAAVRKLIEKAGYALPPVKK